MLGMDKYDLIIIGGGPGGYPAAIRASQLGLRVALIEADKLGGECTNYGCIPTKAMIKGSDLLWMTSKLSFLKGSVSIDYSEYMEWVGSIVSRVSSGVSTLLKKYDVEVYEGRGHLESSTKVVLDDGRPLWGDKIIIATGTDPLDLPVLRVDGDVVHNNRTILGLMKKPSSIAIVGGGYIGVEYADVMAKLGVEVTVIEMMPRLLPGMDQDLARVVERRLKALGVKVYTDTMVKDSKVSDGYAVLNLTGNRQVEAEKVLVAVGRKPRTVDVGLENAGVRVDNKGYIKVDRGMQTSNPRIYASGDVAGPPLLAHKAFMQATVAAENAAGLDSIYEPRAVPSVVYTTPELASIGLTLEEAKKEGFNAKSTKFPIGGLPRALIDDAIDGFVKVVFDDDSKTLLGVHVAAPHASELASEIALALEFGATLEDVSLTIHPHPTISEAIKEAAELALEKPIHYVLRRRKKT